MTLELNKRQTDEQNYSWLVSLNWMANQKVFFSFPNSHYLASNWRLPVDDGEPKVSIAAELSQHKGTCGFLHISSKRHLI